MGNSLKNKMGGRIFFVGGAAASGKTTTINKLSSLHSIPVIELDKFYICLINSIRDCEVLNNATNQIALEFVEQLLRIKVVCIVEGGWILPEQANKLKEMHGCRFSPVYCGYPSANMESRYLAIKECGEHWLNDKQKNEAQRFIDEQIRGSNWFRQECELLKIDFFDFSDFCEGTKALEARFERWVLEC